MASPYPTRGVVVAASLSALYADSDVFPFLPGREFTVSKSAAFATHVRRAASGREVRQSLQENAQWRWKISHSFMRDLASKPEIQRLWGFYVSRRGRFGSFFYYDPDESAVSNYQFGVGTGSATSFVIYRPVGAAPSIEAEPVRAFWGTPTITVNGTPTSAFTINPWGGIVFASPPASGAVLRWSGTPLFVCRFDDDELSAAQFARSFWSQDGLSFASDLP